MIQLKEIKTNHEHYPFMEQLLETAFPLQERRDSDKQNQYFEERKKRWESRAAFLC